MDWVNLYLGLHGRLTRQPFWIGVLILAAVEFAIQLVADQFQSERMSAVFDLITTYPEFALAVKRAHDRNIPTWIIVVFFALNVAVDLMLFAGYGLNPTARPVQFYVIAVPGLLLFLVLLIELGFRRGTQGDNRYGPDPLVTKPLSRD